MDLMSSITGNLRRTIGDIIKDWHPPSPFIFSLKEVRK